MKNIPQLVNLLDFVGAAAGSIASSSLRASNSMSMLKGAMQSKNKGND